MKLFNTVCPIGPGQFKNPGISRCSSVGRVLALGARCRTFEPCHLDQSKLTRRNLSRFLLQIAESAISVTSRKPTKVSLFLSIKINKFKNLNIHKQRIWIEWPFRLSARTQDFHSWKTGSIPVVATI